ncbi:MAG: methyltransferase domain-containing protein [Anaerolineales bacterium]
MPQVARIDDKQYLSDQYRDAANLNARIVLHKRFSINPYGWLRWVFDRISLPPVNRILELGCGPGGLWGENADRIPRGWEITLSDASPGMLEQARASLEAAGRPFRFEVIDAQSIPFPDGTFDAVIANHMLYHVPDRKKALREIRRVLRPGGRFFASTIGNGHLRELADLAIQFDPALVSWGGPSLAKDTFTLENGAAQIAPLFNDVSLHRYEDALVITEPAPLVDYVLSGRIKLDGEERAKFVRYVEQEMERRGGVFRVTKESGLFEAVRG